MSQVCPNSEGCPIFTGALKDKAFTTKSYKSQFCEAGDEGRNSCRRWQVGQKYGKVPEKLMPNSSKTVEEIGEEFVVSV